MGRKTSIVWNHFTIPALYPKKALCNYCHQLVCRGQANLGTTSLMNHLKRCNEFKANVLGIPRGINDMMAAAMSAADAQTTRLEQSDERADSGESVTSVDAESADALLNEPGWQVISGSPSLQSIPRIDDVPSFVGRHLMYSCSNPDSPNPASTSREYQSSERPSVLLYGDISSTSEPTEEPSSSTFGETPTMSTSTVSELMNYASSSSRVDFVYGGIMLHVLYQQYKMGKYCDMHIMPQKISSNEVTISETGKVTKKSVSSPKEDIKISVHSSVLAAVSRKVNSFVDMGCSTIQLKKGCSDSVKGLMEIVYTGKLERIRTYSETQLTEILEVARFLEVDYAVQYLMQEIPEGRPTKAKNSVEKLIQERLQSLKSTPNWSLQSSLTSQTSNLSEGNVDLLLNDATANKEHASQLRKPPGLIRKRAMREVSHDDFEEKFAKRSFLASQHHTAYTSEINAVKESVGAPRKTANPTRKRPVHEINFDDLGDRIDSEIADNTDAPLALNNQINSERLHISSLRKPVQPVKSAQLPEKVKGHIQEGYNGRSTADSLQPTRLPELEKPCKVEWCDGVSVDSFSEEAQRDEELLDPIS